MLFFFRKTACMHSNTKKMAIKIIDKLFIQKHHTRVIGTFYWLLHRFLRSVVKLAIHRLLKLSIRCLFILYIHSNENYSPAKAKENWTSSYFSLIISDWRIRVRN